MRHKGLKNLVLLFGLLIGLSAFGQNTLWQYNSPSPLVFDPSIGPNGYVYFATDDSMLRALDTEGQPAWEVKPGSLIVTPLAVSEDRLFFIVASNEAMGYGTDGKKVWSTNISAQPTGPLAVSGENKIFFGTNDGYLYCLDGNGGAVLWKKKLGYICGPPTVGNDGTLYCASENYLHAVDQKGNIKWRQNSFNYSPVPIAIDSYDHLFYIRGGIMDVYDKFGNYMWEAYDNDGKLVEVEKIPPVIYGDTAIFVNAGGSDFYAFDVFSGYVKWQYSATCDDLPNDSWSPAIAGIPAVDSSGMAMFCDTEGVIVYFEVECGHLYGWHPTVEGYNGTNVILAGRNTGGLMVVATGQGKRSIIAFAHWNGPAGGPWSQWLGTPTHLQRRDDAPMLQMNKPLPADNITTWLEVQGTAADDYGLKSLEVYINGDFVFKTMNDYIGWGTDAATFADGQYDVSLVARDYAGNQTVGEVTVNIQTPTPVYGMYSSPPLFSWLPNSNDLKYQVNISPDPSFYYVLATSATPERGYKKMLSWTPSKKKWKKVLKYAASQASNQTLFYWRAVGKYDGEVVTKTFIIDKTQ